MAASLFNFLWVLAVIFSQKEAVLIKKSTENVVFVEKMINLRL